MAHLYKKCFKRLIDVILSLILIIIISPFFLLLSFLVASKLGRPVLFKQSRAGLNKNIFTMFKFRTMSNETDETGALLPDEKRLTKFGRMLRSTSLDELPELLNILKGEMSFVGPRPLLASYLPLYNQEQSRRHLVRPGLTGLAQVNGRNSITWEEKFDLDCDYVDNYSFLLDVKIAIKTVLIVLKKDGINAENSETNELFLGSLSDE